MQRVRDIATFGYRYWNVDANGTLRSPIRYQWAWPTGLIRSECERRACRHKRCTCGLYALSAEAIDEGWSNPYFDAGTGRIARTSSTYAVGALWLFSPIVNKRELRAKHGMVAALAISEGASGVEIDRITRSAARYDVPVSGIDGLRAAAFSADVADLCVRRSWRDRSTPRIG